MPFAPGTFGSLLGLVWLVCLLLPGSLWLFGVGLLAGLFLSVWLCGKAETILNRHDPPSVVLDEITALPIAFLPWVASECLRRGEMPPPLSFFGGRWWFAAAIYAAFRLFDIWKPWPVRQSQKLPAGLGVTADDVLAALYVALLTIPFLRYILPR